MGGWGNERLWWVEGLWVEGLWVEGSWVGEWGVWGGCTHEKCLPYRVMGDCPVPCPTLPGGGSGIPAVRRPRLHIYIYIIIFTTKDGSINTNSCYSFSHKPLLYYNSRGVILGITKGGGKGYFHVACLFLPLLLFLRPASRPTTRTPRVIRSIVVPLGTNPGGPRIRSFSIFPPQTARPTKGFCPHHIFGPATSAWKKKKGKRCIR